MLPQTEYYVGPHNSFVRQSAMSLMANASQIFKQQAHRRACTWFLTGCCGPMREATIPPTEYYVGQHGSTLWQPTVPSMGQCKETFLNATRIQWAHARTCAAFRYGPIRIYALATEAGPTLLFPRHTAILHMGSTDYYSNTCYMGSSHIMGDAYTRLLTAMYYKHHEC